MKTIMDILAGVLIADAVFIIALAIRYHRRR